MPAVKSASSSAPQRIVVLGSTGSIGTQTLDVVRRLGPQTAQIVGLAARRNVDLLAEQTRASGALYAAVTEDASGPALEAALTGSGALRVGWGEGTMEYLASLPEADTVVVAVAGAAGLRATLAAVEAGKRVCIATKEVLVAAGEIIMKAAFRSGAAVLPVDSEHSAIFQCMQGYRAEQIARLWITGSGGPFRTWTREQIATARPEDAVNHPIWRMGGKISVDSATLMNKGLEIIEAHHFFGVALNDIEVVIHPQSVVHSFVEFSDGALIAQMGCPDMRLPIQVALTFPDKPDTDLPRLRPDQLGELTWERPDTDRFPAIVLARAAARVGGTAPAVLNAANETAVGLFLDGRIAFPDICRLVENALAALPAQPAESIDAVLAADADARRYVETAYPRLAAGSAGIAGAALS